MTKVTLKQDHSIAGEMRKKGDTVEVHDGVADWLIERGIAEKPTAKKESSK